MITLTELVYNYINPPEVKELFREYATFHETLIPTNEFPLPEKIQKLMERMYELGGIPQGRINRAVQDLPQLEQKISELKTKYSWQTVIGLGAAVTSMLYVVSPVFLRILNPELESTLLNGLYVAYGVALAGLTHGIRSASNLVEVRDIEYCVDTVLKQGLSTSKTVSKE